MTARPRRTSHSQRDGSTTVDHAPGDARRPGSHEPHDRVVCRARRSSGRWKPVHLGRATRRGWPRVGRRPPGARRAARRPGGHPSSRTAPAWVMPTSAIQALGAVVGRRLPEPARGRGLTDLLDHSGSVVADRRGRGAARQGARRRGQLPAPASRIVVVDTPGRRHRTERPRCPSRTVRRARGARPVRRRRRRAGAKPSRRRPDGHTPSIVYTSGTTGPPKGAMMCHANLMAAARGGGHGSARGRARRRGALVPPACATSPSGCCRWSTPSARATW